MPGPHVSARIALPFALLLIAAGCATTTGRDFNILSTNDEIELGKQFSAQVEQEEAVLAEPALQAYVVRVGERLAKVSPRQDVEYTFKVIDAPDTVNAFALPGGFMYVYTGLMKICESEAELASVMAHEIAHVAAYHHGEAFTRQWLAGEAAGYVLGEDPAAAHELVAKVFLAGVSARFSRVQEHQADQLGMEILFRAGYRPDAMVDFMYKLVEQSKGHPYLPIFSSHPPTEARVQRLQTLVQQYPIEIRVQNPTYSQRYREEVLSRFE